MHDVLSDPYRRAILYYLQDSDGPADVREVAERVLARRRDEAATREDGADPIETETLESHFRSMDEFGLVEYDRKFDTIRLSTDVSFTIPHRWNE